jgi:Tfp pilus assembly protein PilO
MAKSGASRILYLVIYGLVSAVILVLLYLVLGRLVLNYEKQTKAEFKTVQNKLKQSQELVNSLPDPAKAIEEIEKKAQDFKEMGLGRKQLPRITQLLGQAAGERNIDIISIRPRDDIKSGSENLPSGVSKVYMEITLNCNYQELADYVKSLDGLAVSFILESLSVEKKQGGASFTQTRSPGKAEAEPKELQATLLLSTYMVLEL